MEREKFEMEFGDAFKGAEQSPSENVWVNIELDLERAEGKKMKRRVLFYQMLAAASITFAVLMTGAGLLFLRGNEGENTNLANNVPSIGQHSATDRPNAPGRERAGSDQPAEPTSQSPSGDKNVDEIGELPDQTSDTDLLATAERTDTERIRAFGNKETENAVEFSNERPGADGQAMNRNDLKSTQNYTDANDATRANTNQSSEFSRDNSGNSVTDRERMDSQAEPESREIPGPEAIEHGREPIAFADPGITGDSLANSVSDTREETVVADTDGKNDSEEESSEPDPVALMFARLNDLEKELAEQSAGTKKKGNGEKIWTSVGFAAGGYNGQASAPMQANALALNSAVENQAEASGVAYSVSISMGTRITNRLVVQGGLSYLNNNTSYISNQVVRSENMDFKPATISDLRAAGSSLFNNNTVIPTAPHSVNNNMEFLSIPVQAGYIIIDRKFGLQFNAGVATDFFIQNTIDPQGSGVKATTQDRGAESPYRSTNFSGLMGTEFSYRLGQHYRLALNPGLRYPLNSIYKEETGIESTPITFDVGLRFRYIFR